MASETLERVDWKHETRSVQGKSVIVTGGTTGIGRAVAVLLASQGAKVTIFGRNDDPLQDALKDIEAAAGGGGEVFGLTADQAAYEDVQRVFREAEGRFGGVDLLVANAGLAAGSVTDMDFQDVEYVVRTNVLGYMAVAKEYLARAQSKGEGHIIFVGSMSADAKNAGSDVYVATKTAVAGFADSLRKQVNEKGIRVTLIEPGLTGANLKGDDVDTEEQRGQIAEATMLTAEDIAESVYYALTQPTRAEVVKMEIKPLKQIL